MASAEITFWNVQHGHAVYLRSPNNRNIVIDLGTGNYQTGEEFSPLQQLRDFYEVDQLDYVIITHPHVDHIDDIFSFDDLNPKVLRRPKHLDKIPILDNASSIDRPKLEKYFEINERYNETIADDSFDNPKNPSNWGGLSIKSFVPSSCSQSNLNNHSIVNIFEFENIKILIPGDNEPPSWNELNEMSGFKDITENVDLLLAPHHGRDSGFDNDTMRHFNPRITVISDGSYGDKSATSRYSAISRGWTVYSRRGGSEERSCVTTRNDGVIMASFGFADGARFLNVTIA